VLAVRSLRKTYGKANLRLFGALYGRSGAELQILAFAVACGAAALWRFRWEEA